MKIQVGQTIPAFRVTAINGDELKIPDPSARYTHLQFRRFAGCPICNFHLHEFFKGKAQVEAASIREVIFFHSSVEEMRKYQSEFAYAVVADPDKKFYRQFGVGQSMWASLHPKAMLAAIRGMLRGTMGVKIENAPLGLPADILIDRNGKIVALKYGNHAYDQWELAELLGHAVPA